MKIGQVPEHIFRNSFIFLLLIFFSILPLFNLDSLAADFPLHHKPQFHDIVFLGTRHKQPLILNFISDLITALHNSGVTHIGLEIISDQQGKIDQFMKTCTQSAYRRK